MVNVLVEDSYLSDIADAIRQKKSSVDTYKPSEMADAIMSIPSGTPPTGTISISTNGTHDVTNYAYASVSVPTGTARSSSDLTANNLTVTAPAGLYASNATKTLSDVNLVASNIKKDVTIFGTTGTYEGGGGGSGIAYTLVNSVTVLNNSSVGYTNHFTIADRIIKDVKTIEAEVKFDTALSHCIWFSTVGGLAGVMSAPFADKATGNTITVSQGSTDADGFTKYTLTYSGSSTNIILFGSWNDSTYSHNVSYKTIKGYDSNSNLLFELKPCVDANGNACLVNVTPGAILAGALYACANAIAGEP